MNKKSIKYIIISMVLLLIVVFSFIIYKNIFAQSNSSRYENIENYKLTKNEINSIKKEIKELEQIKNIDVYVDSKIIKIVIKLNDDIDLNKVKEIANKSLSGIDKENLTYYDVEFFVESAKEKSDIYPQTPPPVFLCIKKPYPQVRQFLYVYFSSSVCGTSRLFSNSSLSRTSVILQSELSSETEST